MQETLARETRNYWDSYESSTPVNKLMRVYVCESNNRLNDRSLLQAELDYARERRHLVDRTCETLVLLVGFSLEPLLQSVCVYKPKKIALILNESGYGEEEWHVLAEHVAEAVGYLADKRLIEQTPHFPGRDSQKKGFPVSDTPQSVFQTLVQVLHDERDVVIDITGGKKSMVSGAYLYAAYSGAPVSYVDFDQYDPSHRRPYGYSCRIDLLDNPYETFALRDWERVRALYQRYQFHEARRVLESLAPAVKEFMPGVTKEVQTLDSFLGYYELWDCGDYRAAKQAGQKLPTFEQPDAVKELGDTWYETRGNDFVNRPAHFYGNLSHLKAYAADELARIGRLIDFGEDYRSAFSRAAGLNEIIMLARVVKLVSSQADQQLLLNALNQRTPNASAVFEALTDPALNAINPSQHLRFKNAPNIQIPRPSPMNAWWSSTGLFSAANGWSIFIERRNELSHKYFSVPRQWAEDALKFVTANLEDFLGCAVPQIKLRTEALPWSKLCEMCGLSPYLPPSLRQR